MPTYSDFDLPFNAEVKHDLDVIVKSAALDRCFLVFQLISEVGISEKVFLGYYSFESMSL